MSVLHCIIGVCVREKLDTLDMVVILSVGFKYTGIIYIYNTIQFNTCGGREGLLDGLAPSHLMFKRGITRLIILW